MIKKLKTQLRNTFDSTVKKVVRFILNLPGTASWDPDVLSTVIHFTLMAFIGLAIIVFLPPSVILWIVVLSWLANTMS